MARFPKINLDITHRCTLQCKRCNRAIFARHNVKVPGQDLSVKDYKKILSFFKEVYFCGQISDPKPMSSLKIRDIGQMMSGAMSYD